MKDSVYTYFHPDRTVTTPEGVVLAVQEDIKWEVIAMRHYADKNKVDAKDVKFRRIKVKCFIKPRYSWYKYIEFSHDKGK